MTSLQTTGRAFWLSVGLGAFAIAVVALASRPGPAELESGQSITIETVPVPLDPDKPSRIAIGHFHYAGGLALTSADTDRLHGLSDLVVTRSNRLTVVGDEGSLLHARIVLDAEGRLAGLRDARLAPLSGEDGQPLADKNDADAEGLVEFRNGDRLVSFEQRHRIWRYPAAGGPPRPAPSPDVTFPPNGGMEAIAPDPEAAADAYVVGGEESGETWTCRLSIASCTAGPAVPKPEAFGLVSMVRLPGMRTAYLLRAFEAGRGNLIILRIVRANMTIDELRLEPPMTVDNFEGLSAVPGFDRRIRFYMISDDNASATQRTLLLAFDWRPR